MSRELPFDFEIPISVFSKASAEPGKQRRIGGIVSLETIDQQKEKIIQKGLNFKPFLDHGWLNDNHSKKTTDILGYPEKVRMFQKGESLPNGDVAAATGHWIEGYLVDTDEANRVWDLGKALAKTNRRLGFSVEGKILKRTNGGRNIAQADVRNVAITNCPVHSGSKLEILAKSLTAVEQTQDDEEEDNEVQKTLGMGTPATPGAAPVGPQTGMGAGQVLATESLEGKTKKKGAKSKIKKSLPDRKLRELVKAQFPNINEDQITRFIDLARKQKL